VELEENESMNQSLTSETLTPVLNELKKANQSFVAMYPGDTVLRQPIHTVYGGAHLFKSDLAKKMSASAMNSLKAYAPDARSLMAALGKHEEDAKLWGTVYDRMTEKLQREAVEDFRIDFEDGYGNRPEAEEDGHAESAAKEVAKGIREKTLPPFIGIRIKPFNDENVRRSARTLDIFLTTLLKESAGKLPEGFVVTLPKITIVEQSQALTSLLAVIEKKNGLKQNELKFELMVETPQSVLDRSGRSPLREFVNAGQGRCIAAHFGTYDYTAGCNITAAFQMMGNPVCDFAKHVMQVSLAGSPIMLSDGATNIMPVGPHRETEGNPLTKQQVEENKSVVHNAWRISYGNVRHSLETGYYQGWDLHPAQLPIRYAATYAFFLEALEPASARLKAFVEKAAKATLLGDVFDDAATGQGLLNFFLRGLSCGAITMNDATRTGLTLEDLQTRSFLKILERRK
jgi:citrate lyase beta subunit